MDYAKNAKNAVSQAVKGSAKFRDLVQSALIAVALESFHSGNVARMDDLLSHLKGADYRAVMTWVKEFTLIRKNEGKACQFNKARASELFDQFAPQWQAMPATDRAQCRPEAAVESYRAFLETCPKWHELSKQSDKKASTDAVDMDALILSIIKRGEKAANEGKMLLNASKLEALRAMIA